MTSTGSLKSSSTDMSTVYAYHLLRNSVEKYQKPYHELNQEQNQDVTRRADKSYALESLVLSSDEARDVIIPEEDINRAVSEIATRYENNQDFIDDMERNNLDEDVLRQALYRELIFNTVMEKVASYSVTTSDIDIRLFYEFQRDKFSSPETRKASHILITINPEYKENTREAAYARITKISDKVKRNPGRFSAEAKKYSECPTALEGGALGVLKAGSLYPELDGALFSLEQGEVSDIIESELGFHIIYCQKIYKAKVLPLSKVYDRIRTLLDNKKRRACQKAWIKQLQERSNNSE
jgi:peptidyl-prolyl cis-trans isomerase C